jgi:hypothetical protein
MVAGCATRLSTPPSDSASENRRSPPTNILDGVGAALEFDADHRAETALLAFGYRMPGCVGSPGSGRGARLADLTSQAASAFALVSWRLTRGCSVRKPRKVRKLSKAAPVMPSAFAHQASCCASSAAAATHRTADDIAVAVDVLRGRMHHDVGAEGERILQRWRQEGVVDHRSRSGATRKIGGRPTRP